MIVVVDTNVIVSAFIQSKGYPALVLDALLKGSFEIAISPMIEFEYQHVLTRAIISPYLHYSDEQIQEMVADLLDLAILVDEREVNVSADPKDNKFFGCAFEAGADFIISGDKHILDIPEYKGTRTITPGQFVEEVLMFEKAV